MERSGRVRKASQKVVESRGNFHIADDASVVSKRKAKNGSNKAQSAKLSKGTSVYEIPVPTPLANQYMPSSVALSLLDKAAQVTVSPDQMTCTGAPHGFRMIRATHGVHVGPYYWECEILPHISSPDTVDLDNSLQPHVRVGWSTRFGELRGPVGYDKHSYGYRDVGGKNEMR